MWVPLAVSGYKKAMASKEVYSLFGSEECDRSCDYKKNMCIFLSSYSVHTTQVMLIFILIDAQHLQNVVFNFEKGSNGQSHSSSVSHHLVKKSPHQHFSFHLPLLLFGKPEDAPVKEKNVID